ncbi:hypothetical protein Tco_1041307 [Tanacetum coccineum]|uniref:Integrase, catalytic region, zinc finger, CCHC-type, peptidase aspartic, catalytic n=1 Tax=Tanacetum coccineum TaxID=301880 RepID=A0ABQ5GFS6_9ASTR
MGSISANVPIYLVLLGIDDPSHEEVDDDLGESRVVHLITPLDILILYLINKVLQQKNSMNSSDPSPSCRPTKVEILKELLKVSMINTSLKKLKHHLAGFDVVVKERTTTTTITEGSWGFEHTKACFRALFCLFDDQLTSLSPNNCIHPEVLRLVFKDPFYSMEVLFGSTAFPYVSASSLDFSTMGVSTGPRKNDILPIIDTVIKKLQERIKSLSGNMNEDKIKKDLEEIETINIEVDHRVSKLIAKNEHLKQTYKQLYDSIKPTRVRSKEQCDALVNQVNQKSVEISDLNASLQEKVLVITALKNELRKLKGKSVIACRESVNKPKVIAPVVHKVDLEPLSPKLKNNREAHVDYIRITKENADTLRDIVEQARTLNPLDNALDYACIYTKHIQELLLYVSDICPSSPLKSEKLVAVTPMNKARKVTFAKTSTTSDNNTQIQVDVHQTQTTSKPLVPSTNEKCSTNASRSKPQSETKNHRIMQPLSSNQKSQKIEAHTRNAKPSLTKENSESKFVCLTCNKCYFDARHDFCVVQHLSEVNDRTRAKAVKSIKMKEWKPTGKMFKNVGYKWVPTGRTFTIVGTKCPLTRFTSTKIVPPRKPVKSTIITNKKPSSASQWRPKETNHASSSSAPKIVESRTANHLEPNNHMGSKDLLFQPLFDELFNPPSSVDRPAPEVIAPIAEVVAPVLAASTGSPSSTTVDQDAPSPSNSQTTPEIQSPVILNDVKEDNHDLDVAHMNNDPFFGIPIPENDSEASSSSDVIPIVVHTAAPNSEHITKWTKDHPLDNINVEPKKYKDALTQACWIKAMQEELNEFERLEVWELVPRPDKD